MKGGLGLRCGSRGHGDSSGRRGGRPGRPWGRKRGGRGRPDGAARDGLHAQHDAAAGTHRGGSRGDVGGAAAGRAGRGREGSAGVQNGLRQGAARLARRVAGPQNFAQSPDGADRGAQCPAGGRPRPTLRRRRRGLQDSDGRRGLRSGGVCGGRGGGGRGGDGRRALGGATGRAVGARLWSTNERSAQGHKSHQQDRQPGERSCSLVLTRAGAHRRRLIGGHSCKRYWNRGLQALSLRPARRRVGGAGTFPRRLGLSTVLSRLSGAGLFPPVCVCSEKLYAHVFDRIHPLWGDVPPPPAPGPVERSAAESRPLYDQGGHVQGRWPRGGLSTPGHKGPSVETTLGRGKVPLSSVTGRVERSDAGVETSPRIRAPPFGHASLRRGFSTSPLPRSGLWSKRPEFFRNGLPPPLPVMSSGAQRSRDISSGGADAIGDADAMETSPLRLSAVEPPVEVT